MKIFAYAFILSCALLLTVPATTHASGPTIIIDLSNHSVESQTGNKTTTIEFSTKTKELQAIRFKRDNIYYIAILSSDGDTVRLQLYNTQGEKLQGKKVFEADGSADFSVLKIISKKVNDVRIFEVKGVKTNTSGQPVNVQQKQFKIKPTAEEKIQYQSSSKTAIGYPNISGKSDADAGYELYNYHRMASGLLPIGRSTDLDHGCALHAEYMRLNNELTHYEESDKPGYTEEGNASGGASNVTKQTDGSMVSSLNILMGAVYHRFSMIDNYLQKFGYAISGKSSGGYRYGCYDTGTEAIFDNGFGDENHVTYYDPANHAPIPHPGVGQTHVPTKTNAGEWPDPLEPFGGTYPAGYSISLGFSALDRVTNMSVQLLDPAGKSVPGYFRAPGDATDPNYAYQGNNMTYIPKNPLSSNSTYTVKVSAKVDGVAYKKEWSFTTE